MAAKKTYSMLVSEAISAINDRTGSSAQAIKAYIITNYPTIQFAQHQLRSALKKSTEKGKLIQVKNSYKLPTKALQTKSQTMVIAAKTMATQKTATKRSVKKVAETMISSTSDAIAYVVKKTTPKKKAAPKKVGAKPKATTATKKVTKKPAASPKKKVEPKAMKAAAPKITKAAPKRAKAAALKK